MEVESQNNKKIKKYLYSQVDIDCETALPGGSIYGTAWTNLKLTKSSKNLKIKISNVRALLIMRSENSKAPHLHSNKELEIFNHEMEDYHEGLKQFEVESIIPQDAFTSLDMEGFDFGEFKNILFVKLIIEGTYLIPKKKSKQVHDVGQKMANLAPVIPEKKHMEKIAMDGTSELVNSKPVIAQKGKHPEKVKENEEQYKEANPGPKKAELQEEDLFQEIKFVHVQTEEVEIDHDTPGEKVHLEKPIVRKFTTQTGSCCCKKNTTISMEGVIYNPNLRSYADEIKFHFKMDTHGRANMFKSLAVITSFGCVPAEDPRPDLMVWQALSIYRFFPDSELTQGEFDTKENSAYLENNMYKDPHKIRENHFKHFVTNTRKNQKIKTHFSFPKPDSKSSKIELYGKIKIGRRNGLGTFYTRNKVFKTMYGLKFVPVFKGSDTNGAQAKKGKVGAHLTIPFSVKAKNEPSKADLRALNSMYLGKDVEHTLNKSPLGKMKNMVVPMVPGKIPPQNPPKYIKVKDLPSQKIPEPNLKGHKSQLQVIEINNPNYNYDSSKNSKVAIDDGESIKAQQDFNTSWNLNNSITTQPIVKENASKFTKSNIAGQGNDINNSIDKHMTGKIPETQPVSLVDNKGEGLESEKFDDLKKEIPQGIQEKSNTDKIDLEGNFEYPASEFNSDLHKQVKGFDLGQSQIEAGLNPEKEGLNSTRNKVVNQLEEKKKKADDGEDLDKQNSEIEDDYLNF